MRSHSRQIRLRAGALLLTAAALFGARLAHAQSLAPDELDYYLVQAFEAPRAEQRIALNHIGIAVQADEQGYLVTAVLEAYPAHEAGIQRGDRILRVDGTAYHPVYSFNSNPSDGLDYVPSPREHRIEYLRGGDELTAVVVPVFENLYDSYRSATLDSTLAFPLGNKRVGYVRLWSLSRSTSDLFSLDLMMDEFALSDGLIVDLRDAYGYLSRKHLDLFLRDARVDYESSIEAQQHIAIESIYQIATARPFTKPIVVLINSETRGGAELLAYELSKSGRIITMGETSAGKIGAYRFTDGVLEYQPDTALRIDGQPFESGGVIPQVTVTYPFNQSSRSDPQFESAIDYLLGRI